MSDLEKAIDAATPVLGEEGAKALGTALEDLAKETDNEIGQEVLGWVASTVEANGAAGVVALKDWIMDLAKGDTSSPIPKGINLRQSSDIYARLQNKEADDMSEFRDTMVVIGDTLGTVLLGIVKGLIK